MRRRIKAPSPAMVVALIALFVSIGGVGYAASKIGTDDIKDGAVTKEKLHRQAVATGKIQPLAVKHGKIADLAVRTDKLADQSVTNDKLADNSVTSTKIANGEVRAGDLGTITTVTNTVTGIANNANGSVTASCPEGTQVLSGGGQPTFFGVEMTASLRNGNGWLYQARNLSGSPTTLTAFAYCLAG